MLGRAWNWGWWICEHQPRIKRATVRAWYDFFSELDTAGEVRFMNYGYAALNGSPQPLPLESVDEPNRYPIQMYHHVASGINLRGLDVLEVGSGRGGGAAFVMRQHPPRTYAGVDISPRAIAYCQRQYPLPRLCFRQGDAEELEFPDASFDAVINIESSSHYGLVENFFHEAWRILRPGGYLLFADIRKPHELRQLHAQFRKSRLRLLNQEFITANVVAALDLDHTRKLKLIEQRTPRVLHGAVKEFAGTQGTEKYKFFLTGIYEYVYCVLQKPPASDSLQVARF